MNKVATMPSFFVKKWYECRKNQGTSGSFWRKKRIKVMETTIHKEEMWYNIDNSS